MLYPLSYGSTSIKKQGDVSMLIAVFVNRALSPFGRELNSSIFNEKIPGR
jgi:hypothetical protein